MIAYFKDKNNKSEKECKKYKTLSTILKSSDTSVIIATTSNSLTLSLTGIGLVAIPISVATKCGLLIGNKVKDEVIVNKYNKYKKQYEKYQQTVKSLDKLYRIFLQGIVNNKFDYESLCNFFTKYLEDTIIESLL